MEVVKLRPDLSMEDFNVPLILTVVGGWIIIWCAMLSERIRHGRVGIYSRASMIRKHFHCNSIFELSVLNTGSFLRYHAQISCFHGLPKCLAGSNTSTLVVILH